MTKRWIACIVILCLCASVLCGCTDLAAPQPVDASAAESATEPTVSNDRPTGTGNQYPAGMPMETVQTVNGLRVTSGSVIKMKRNAMQFAPASSSGTFAVNGLLSADSEIAFCVNPSGILNYKLSLDVEEDKAVTAEIRVYKNGALLASHEQPGVLLKAGECDIDACIETGEKSICSGIYIIRFYIDGCCVSETTDYV